MSDILKAALVLGAAIVIATAIMTYFSPYQSCVPAFEGSSFALRCAQAVAPRQ